MVQMWLSPRDLCALAATAAARARVQQALASHMNISLDSPELLFAMTNFHNFYSQTFERCVNSLGTRADRHELIEAPELVHRLLEALGFCTYTDEHGVERPLQDPEGRPVCAFRSFLSDARQAFALPTSRGGISAGGSVTDPLFFAGRRANALYQLRNMPGRLEQVKQGLQLLRPKKADLLVGKLRIYDYTHNLDAWEGLHEAFLSLLGPATRTVLATTQPGAAPVDEKALTRASLQLRAAAKSADVSLKKLVLPADRRSLVDERLEAAAAGGARTGQRDQMAAAWRLSFQKFVEETWRPLIAELSAQTRELLESTGAIELATRTPRAEAAGAAPTGALSTTSSLASFVAAAEEEPVPLRQFFKEDACFQRHGRDEASCNRDSACNFERSEAASAEGGGKSGDCRSRATSLSSKPVVRYIGAAKPLAPPARTPRDDAASAQALAAMQARAPPSSRRERQLEARERQQEQARAAAEKEASAQKSSARSKRSPPLAPAAGQACEVLTEQKCIKRLGCTWHADQGTCTTQHSPVEDLTGHKARMLAGVPSRGGAKKADKPSKQAKRRSQCQQLREESCRGSCVWDTTFEECIPTTLRVEDIRTDRVAADMSATALGDARQATQSRRAARSGGASGFAALGTTAALGLAGMSAPRGATAARAPLALAASLRPEARAARSAELERLLQQRPAAYAPSQAQQLGFINSTPLSAQEDAQAKRFAKDSWLSKLATFVTGSTSTRPRRRGEAARTAA